MYKICAGWANRAIRLMTSDTNKSLVELNVIYDFDKTIKGHDLWETVQCPGSVQSRLYKYDRMAIGAAIDDFHRMA